jgi:membrane protein DedA with SNARE-associated domain
MTELLIGYIEQMAAIAPTWGFFLIFLFMTIESSFIPFPSEVVMIPAGFLAARGGLGTGIPTVDVAISVLMGLLGSLAGAWINYGLALKLGQPFLLRWGKYFFLPPDALLRAEELFREYGAGATFFCRLLPAIRQLISIPAGLARMSPGAFSLWTGLGAGLWVIVLTAIGWTAGQGTAELSYADLVHQGKDTIRANLPWIIPSALGGLAAYVVLSKRIMRRAGA